MAVVIPLTPGDPEQRIEIALDDAVYAMRFRWNTLDDDEVGAWYLDVWERDGKTPIAFSIKLVLGVRLGNTYNHPLFLSGLILNDESGTGIEARLDDLGGRVYLIHMNAADAALAQL